MESETTVHFVGGRIENEGAIFCLSIFLAPLLDSDFNLDYEFVIKHDPIQSDDQFIAFVSCLNRVEPPATVSCLN